MTDSRRSLHLGAFMRPVSIHTGAWRYPGAWPDANFSFPKLKQLIQKLEAGKFDAFFMADHLALLNMPIEALRRSRFGALQLPDDLPVGQWRFVDPSEIGAGSGKAPG